MKPSIALDRHRMAIRRRVPGYRAANPRVFGSVPHGTDHDGSDLDLRVDALPGATRLDLGGLQDDLEQMLRVRVDIRTPGDLPPHVRARVLFEAVPV